MVSLGRWSSPLGLLTPVCFDKLFLKHIIPVQSLVRLPECTSSRATAWQTDLHEGGPECSWGAREEVGVLVLSFALRLHLCIASLRPHGDVLATPPLARHRDQLQIKANQEKSSKFKTGIRMQLTSVESAASSLSSSPPQASNFRRTLLEVCSIHLRRGGREIVLPANPVCKPSLLAAVGPRNANKTIPRWQILPKIAYDRGILPKTAIRPRMLISALKGGAGCRWRAGAGRLHRQGHLGLTKARSEHMHNW